MTSSLMIHQIYDIIEGEPIRTQRIGRLITFSAFLLDEGSPALLSKSDSKPLPRSRFPLPKMLSPGLAVLPCVWAAWNIIGVITIYIININENHYETPYISIRDTGAIFPESTGMKIVAIVSELLGAAIMYVLYRLIQIRTAQRTTTEDIVQKILLAVGWLSCVEKIITTFLPDSIVNDYITIAALLCAVVYAIFTEPPDMDSTHGKCVLLTKKIVALLLLLATMSMMVLKIVKIIKRSSDSCIEEINIIMAILDLLMFICSCIEGILLYENFQVLTIKSKMSLKEDWIILRDHLKETSSPYRKSEPNLQMGRHRRDHLKETSSPYRKSEPNLEMGRHRLISSSISAHGCLHVSSPDCDSTDIWGQACIVRRSSPRCYGAPGTRRPGVTQHRTPPCPHHNFNSSGILRIEIKMIGFDQSH
ncbi:uncharacterized protein LOC143773315 [Ranitomeya variabilis]|uniref:uncharacterized protein LOC143773315 n=1 Tax=Ranitomeya variabilis TaxID=490064 RepID=UPI004055FE1C